MNNGKPRLLIVDDEEANCRALRRVFTHEFDVEMSLNTDDAIEILFGAGRPQVDVVITDFHLPGADGLELMKIVRTSKVGHKIPFIVVSGNIAETLIQEVQGLAFLTLEKPVDITKLMVATKTALRISRELKTTHPFA